MATGFAALPPSSPSSTPKKLKQILREPFKALEDPRVKRKPEHLLVDIVAIAILAVRSGANDLVAVETYGKAKQTWLETFLALPNGIPSHDTFSRVLALLNPQQLHECFLSWVAQLADELAIKLINIDGKTARGSYDREQSLKALPTVSAWAIEFQLESGSAFRTRNSIPGNESHFEQPKMRSFTEKLPEILPAMSTQFKYDCPGLIKFVY